MSQPTSTGISITITTAYTSDLIEEWGGVGSGLRPSYIFESVVPIPGRVVAPAPLIEFTRLGNGDASMTVASDPDHFIVTKVFSDLLGLTIMARWLLEISTVGSSTSSVVPDAPVYIVTPSINPAIME